MPHVSTSHPAGEGAVRSTSPSFSARSRSQWRFTARKPLLDVSSRFGISECKRHIIKFNASMFPLHMESLFTKEA